MMGCKQDRPTPGVLARTPSSASRSTAAASVTSAGTSRRSGGSRLLFGEIDTSRHRSAVDSYASVGSFVLCDSSTFLRFWLDDGCRAMFLAKLAKPELAGLRLVCHELSVRAAPALFADLSVTFTANTFTKPSRSAALDRLGAHVRTLRFTVPHTAHTVLPPLIEPETGAELSFTYTPRTHAGAGRRPRYGDVGTTEILSRQYPAVFHAATNVPAFVRALAALVRLEHLVVSCPGYETAHRYRRTVVDYALISLRIAVEKNALPGLDRLTLAPIHPGGLMYLSPALGLGASPRSAARWSRIKHLIIDADHLPAVSRERAEPDHLKMLQTYLGNFQSNLESLRFRWIGRHGPLPVRRPGGGPCSTGPTARHPAWRQPGGARPRGARPPLHFPRLKRVHVGAVAAPARDIAAFLAAHTPTVEELHLQDIHLTHGTWHDALAPLRRTRAPRPAVDEIPIMLSPTCAAPPPTTGRASQWFASTTAKTTPAAARKVKEGLQGCEEQLRKVWRGSAFPAWR